MRAAGSELPFEILRLANALIRDLIPVLEQFALTPQQAAVLMRIDSLPEPPTLAALGRALSVSKQNVTGMVARLVEARLVDREGDPADLRASRLKLTEAGAALVRQLRPALRRWSRERLGSLAEADRARLGSSIGLLLEVLGAE